MSLASQLAQGLRYILPYNATLSQNRTISSHKHAHPQSWHDMKDVDLALKFAGSIIQDSPAIAGFFADIVTEPAW